MLCNKCISFTSQTEDVKIPAMIVNVLSNFWLCCKSVLFSKTISIRCKWCDLNKSFILVFSYFQFLTFENGKIGVNFGGYHAEAGLGGLLTGNAAHGGLSASAGTPYGQVAGAGLGGSLDGKILSIFRS